MKLPFPLTPQFKSMLQSGVGTRDLDVRWVSSLSWYFLTLFGLQPVYNFILGSNNCGLPSNPSTLYHFRRADICVAAANQVTVLRWLIGQGKPGQVVLHRQSLLLHMGLISGAPGLKISQQAMSRS